MKYLISLIFVLSTPLKASLLEELHDQVTAPHVPLSYHVARSTIFQDVDNENNENCSVYTPSECKRRVSELYGFSLNIEHTWPQSKGAKVFPAVSDMHHLFIASKESNSKRANHPFCYVYEVDWQKDHSILGFDKNNEKCFEPRDSHKGNVARAMFYFSVRYQKAIDEKQEQVLRQWNKLDPVDTDEYERNFKIQGLQGNLNPFIVNQSLSDSISDF